MDISGDILSAPLEVIDDLFHQRFAEFGPGGAEAAVTKQVQDRFCGFAANDQNYKAIPALDRTALSARSVRNNQTVRYRGLVQDVFEVEYFVGICRSDQPAGVSYLKYRDTSGDCGASESTDSIVMERLPLFCIPIPGENDWSAAHGEGSDTSLLDKKRNLAEMQSGDCVIAEVSSKAHRTEATGADHTGGAVSSLHTGVPSVDNGAQSKTEFGATDCLVKLYDFRNEASCGDGEDASSPVVRLNDMIEIIGVLSTYQEPHSSTDEAQDQTAMSIAMISGDPFCGFENSDNVLPKLVNTPTVHGIIFRKLCSAYPVFRSIKSSSGAGGYNICLLGNVFSDSDSRALPFSYAECYESLVGRLSRALGGDMVSASYLALSVISGVTGTGPGDVALGSLTLNIHGMQPDDKRIAKVVSVLREFLPRVVQARLDRDALSTPEDGGYQFFAERSTSTDSIDRSCLQLGAGTVLVVDETRMTEGPVTTNAFRSMKALESVVKSQMLPIDFEYCPGIKIPTDICVVILSKSPSIVGENMIKTLSPTSLFPVGDGHHSRGDGMSVIDGFDASAARRWWAHCKIADASLEQQMVRDVEEDFVRARQGAPHTPAASPDTAVPPYPVEGSDFHNWLTLSRLLAVAEGKPTISAAQWSRIRQLESDRYHNKSRYEVQLSVVMQ